MTTGVAQSAVLAMYCASSTEVGLVNEWKPTFPVILGQRGFFDRFPVTFNRQAQATAVEDWDAFDDCYGIALAPP